MDTAKQMQMAFMEEGGLTDDGTTMDPVSGNEVPPGSMAEEVRDDIPAQLSEGEYVVPADVVRFYGVKFFEDLRMEAKRGLMDMEANGRIGGEPVAQTIDNQTGGELTPEELAALEQIQGMAVGGMVQPTQSTNPYLQQQQMYQNPAPVAMGNTGYAEGGQVLYANTGPDVSAGTAAEPQIDPYQAQFGTQQASMFSPGYLIDQTLSTPQNPVRTITMYGPNGEVEILTLPAQQTRYEELLELGYSETQTQTTTETTVGRDDENDQPPKTKTTPEPLDVSKIKTEDLAKTAKSLGAMTTIATAVASTVGVPITALVNAGMVAQYNDIIDRMESEGIDTEGMTKKGSIFGGESGLYENLKDTGGTLDKDGNVIGDGKVGFGDTWLGDLLGFDGKAGVQGDNLRESFGGSRRTGGDDDGGTPVVTPSSNDNNNNASTGATSAQVASATQTSQEANAGTDYTPGNDQFDNQVEYDADFYNQGGMVKRRKNKKKK
jgi:hypothetical protein